MFVPADYWLRMYIVHVHCHTMVIGVQVFSVNLLHDHLLLYRVKSMYTMPMYNYVAF